MKNVSALANVTGSDRPAICLFDADTGALANAAASLAECGLWTWRLDSRDIHVQLDDHPGTLCFVIDLPGRHGLSFLQYLRHQAVSLPAILIAGAEDVFPKDRLTSACVVDVLPRPVNRRDLLSWVECIAVSQRSLMRTQTNRSRQKPASPSIAGSVTDRPLSEIPSVGLPAKSSRF